ncbi:MAG: DUF3368 domain-containing protein [Chloroflexi bacterium]|nr:DUF3368 domain-containing protein [Chloroflexota bacterium]
MNVIANTTIISNFAETGRLDLLRDLLGALYLSTDVYAEIQDGLAEGYDFYTDVESEIQAESEASWLHLTAPQGAAELQLFARLSARLHRGEASCLAIAAQRGWAFLSDDARARRIARDLNVTTSGTLGALVQAVQRNLITLEDANALLAQMIRAGYHAPSDNLDGLISK